MERREHTFSEFLNGSFITEQHRTRAKAAQLPGVHLGGDVVPGPFRPKRAWSLVAALQTTG